MTDKYILDGKKLVKCEDFLTWARWFETADRRVAVEQHDDVKVSTVFLGIDHSFGVEKPLLFETMVFGGQYDNHQKWYSTWEEAEKGHAEMCKKVFNSCTREK